MKFVNENVTKLTTRSRLSLPQGAVFRYPDGDGLYMKTSSGHVSLNLGQYWLDSAIPDKEVIVLEATLTYKDKL